MLTNRDYEQLTTFYDNVSGTGGKISLSADTIFNIFDESKLF